MILPDFLSRKALKSEGNSQIHKKAPAFARGAFKVSKILELNGWSLLRLSGLIIKFKKFSFFEFKLLGYYI